MVENGPPRESSGDLSMRPPNAKIIAHFEIEILSSDAFILVVQLICHISHMI